MRTIPICFSMLQLPRCKVHTLAKFSQESFHTISGTSVNNAGFRLVASANSFEGGYSRRWINISSSSKSDRIEKTFRGKHNILDETVSSSAASTVHKTELTEFQKVQFCDIGQKVFEGQELIKPVTLIVFDIETTGFSRVTDRIIEIALQDLQGGEGSTFQTLVNPGRVVLNSDIHGITTQMVCRSEVPRMVELIPILLQFIRSRQKPGGDVLLTAHNGRTFDVPFLISEFQRCNVDMPPNYRFLDTLNLSRELSKSEGGKVPQNLAALREKFGIPKLGTAHRAMADVNTLSLVLQRLTFELKLSLPDLIQRSFTASDLANGKKKSKK